MKVIKINCCKECPHIEHNDGGGHCDAFTICKKYNIILIDERPYKHFAIDKKIHPKCGLEDFKE